MGQPVKLSDKLVMNARLTGKITERSIAGQIEHWASLGIVMDSLMRGGEMLSLKKNGSAKSLAECLAEVETEAGQQSVKEYLRAGPFPHYEPAEGKPGWLLRTEKDGSRVIGRFVHRQFVEHPGGN